MIAEAQDVAVQVWVPRWIAARTLLADYLSLAKPRIGLLLVITETGAMVAAARGWPGLRLMLAAVVGGACSAGGASAVNCWYDRDIDAVMPRTCSRPIPSGRIAPGKALVFGITLSLIGLAVLALVTTMLAAVLALAGGLFYVVVYTMVLKRRTPQNIVIGGAAGAFPPLVGWAAVTGHLSGLAVALSAVIFVWTPPHFWALALLLRRQYAAAGVPMLPSVQSEQDTRRSILAYSALLLGASLVPGLWLGPIYLIGSLALGGGLFLMALRSIRSSGLRWAAQLFHFSLVYLALIFALAAGAAVVWR